MKLISELIRELTEMQEKQGDIPIRVFDTEMVEVADIIRVRDPFYDADFSCYIEI